MSLEGVFTSIHIRARVGLRNGASLDQSTCVHCDIVYMVYNQCTTLYNCSFPLDRSIISEKLTWTELQVTLHGITWLPIDGIE